MSPISSFRQTRKNLGLSLQDTAYLLGIDVSNLSKVEYEKIVPSVRAVIGYHLIVGASLEHLLKNHILAIRQTLTGKLMVLLDQASKDPGIPKNRHRFESLSRVLKNVTGKELTYGIK